MLQAEGPRIGYVLKVYPRFSETFIVSEILAREAAGERLDIFSLRPPADPRFHPELARVKASVSYIRRPLKLDDGWQMTARAQQVVPGFAERFAALLPELAGYDASEVHQGVELAAQVAERGITHLHAHFASLAARTAQIAAALAGISYSVTTHAKDLFHESVDEDRLRGVLTGARDVITISRYNQKFLRTWYPQAADRLHLVYNGLELDRFAYRAPAPVGPELKIAAVGRLVEKKGFGMLINAARVLHDAGLRIQVRIAGGGELESDLASAIADAGLDSTVRLLGPVTQQEVTELLRWADVFAAPCVVGADGNADGLPTVLLEAMAMGVPVVASDVTGIPEVVRPGGPAGPQTGLLIRAGVPEDLVAALRRAAAPDFDRTGIAAQARHLIETTFDSRLQAAALRRATRCDGPAVPATEPATVPATEFPPQPHEAPAAELAARPNEAVVMAR